MFRSLARIPVKSTGDPIRDDELDKAQLEAEISICEVLIIVAFCVLIAAAIAWPHTAAMFVSKVLNGLAAIASALGAVAHN